MDNDQKSIYTNWRMITDIFGRTCFISVFLNIFLAVVLIILNICSQYITDNFERSEVSRLKDDGYKSLCIQCYGISDVADYRMKSVDGEDLCCYKDTEITNIVLTILKEEKRFQQEVKDDDASSLLHFLHTAGGLHWLAKGKSTVHLFLNTSSLSNPDVHLNWVNHWSKTPPSTVDVVVKGNDILVNVTGRYLLYSAITLKMAANVKIFPYTYHTLSRYRSDMPKSGTEILLMNKKGGNLLTGSRLHTSFLCGALHLNAGDHVMSTFSDRDLIYKLPFANYFGVYKL